MRLVLAAVLLAAAPGARAADPGAEAAQSYQLEVSAAPAELGVGAAGTLTIAIVPGPKVHVHPQAPLKVRLAASPGLALSAAQLGRKDLADPKAEAPRFSVPFTATAAGAQEARATVDFFVCSDQWCVKQVREVVAPVTVR
jgi:hypothetical protein